MTSKEMELAGRVAKILGKGNVIHMNLNDIIEELLEVIERGSVSNS